MWRLRIGRLRIGRLTLLLLSIPMSQSLAQEKENLAGDLERCQANLLNCQSQENNADVKREREQLVSANAQLQQQNSQILADTNRVTVVLNNAIYNTSAAQGAKQVIDSIKAHPPRTTTYTQRGTTYVIINLVIGTLRTKYDSALKIGDPKPLTVEFEPHSLGAFKDSDYVHWHLKVDYAPGHTLETKYDPADNGGKDIDREPRLSANLTETWRWQVTALTGFDGDSSPVICSLSFTIDPKIEDPTLAASFKEDSGKPSEIWHDDITWTRAPAQLGQLWLDLSLTELLTTLGAIFGVLTAFYQWRQAATLRAVQKTGT